MNEFNLEHEQSQPLVMCPQAPAIPRSGRKTYMGGARAHHRNGSGGRSGSTSGTTNFATQDEFVYSHEWRVNKLVIWDNRHALHWDTLFEDFKYKHGMRHTTTDEYALLATVG